MKSPKHLIILDIDGLRQDTFHRALSSGCLPHLGPLFAADSPHLHLDPVSPFPSITFCAQTTLFTGTQPGRHGITGNQFLDRFQPRYYAFDIGETLAVDDAVRVFAGYNGLLNETLDRSVPTLYQRAARAGLSSTVAYHMLSRGADTWLRPSVVAMARLTRGGRLFGLSSEEFDQEMLNDVAEHLQDGAQPDILTAYFLGLDHHSHAYGPDAQFDYLCQTLDHQAGLLLEALERHGMLQDTLLAIVSDHGQIDVPANERHALQLGVPFTKELGELFDALDLDVHDLPGEDSTSSAALAANGGMAHVYLRRRGGAWSDLPRFAEDVLPVAHAFWEANQMGRYDPALQGSLAAVLVRDVETDGWQADYRAYHPDGLQNAGEYFEAHPELQVIDAAARLEGLCGPNSGDVLLLSDYRHNFYFGDPEEGVHGGLHPEDSLAVCSLSWLNGPEDAGSLLKDAARTSEDLQQEEGRSRATLADFVPLLEDLFGWE